MAVPQPNHRVVRFGVFELDRQAGELRKSGLRLRLQGQPFQVLTLLLGRAGEVVTREQLQQQLWPSDTFVDFEHSLNTAIKELRAVLNDSATEPRYIETIPRLGYRFIFPLEQGAPEVASTSVVAVEPKAVASPAVPATHATAAPNRPRFEMRRRMKLWL